MIRRIRHVLLMMLVPGALLTATVSGAVGAPAALAYGSHHVYQLTFSLNCDNKASPLCAPDVFGLGGVWGWIEPDSDGTADATITFCAHSQGFNGADHANLDGVKWSIVPASQLGGRFAVGKDPSGQYIVFDQSSPLGFLAFPVTANHYSISFGPGITAQSTVVLMH
jgi:hypothetical protein